MSILPFSLVAGFGPCDLNFGDYLAIITLGMAIASFGSARMKQPYIAPKSTAKGLAISTGFCIFVSAEILLFNSDNYINYLQAGSVNKWILYSLTIIVIVIYLATKRRFQNYSVDELGIIRKRYLLFDSFFLAVTGLALLYAGGCIRWLVLHQR